LVTGAEVAAESVAVETATEGVEIALLVSRERRQDAGFIGEGVKTPVLLKRASRRRFY
jgi:hypothetical protein